MTVPVPSAALVTKDGTPTLPLRQWMQDVQRAGDSTSTGKANASQTYEQSWLIEYPENKDYRVVINSVLARTIERVTTRSTVGTCTLTVKINTTSLGGPSNSVSTSEQTQEHSTANAIAVGDDVVISLASVASAEMVSVTIHGTVTLET